MSRDWFRCVFAILPNVTQVFSESVAQSSSCFANVQLFTQCAGYAIDNICRGTRETISDLNRSLRVDIFSAFWTKGQVLHRERAHLKVLGFSIVLNQRTKKKKSTNAFDSINFIPVFCVTKFPQIAQLLVLYINLTLSPYGGQFTLSTLLINPTFVFRLWNKSLPFMRWHGYRN